MILFNDIVQVLTLTNLDTFPIGSVIVFQAGLIDSALIDIDPTPLAIAIKGFLQKASCSFGIALGRQQKVDGLPNQRGHQRGHSPFTIIVSSKREAYIIHGTSLRR